MNACDSFITEPKRDIDKPFLMPVEDVFSITVEVLLVRVVLSEELLRWGDEVSILVWV